MHHPCCLVLHCAPTHSLLAPSCLHARGHLWQLVFAREGGGVWLHWLCWFIDVHHKGLDGKQAAWSAKKYHGHQALPESLLADLICDTEKQIYYTLNHVLPNWDLPSLAVTQSSSCDIGCPRMRPIFPTGYSCNPLQVPVGPSLM